MLMEVTPENEVQFKFLVNLYTKNQVVDFWLAPSRINIPVHIRFPVEECQVLMEMLQMKFNLKILIDDLVK